MKVVVVGGGTRGWGTRQCKRVEEKGELTLEFESMRCALAFLSQLREPGASTVRG